MTMKFIPVLCAALLAGCASVELLDLEKTADGEANAYAGYGEAMASKPNDPMAVEWQAAHASDIEKAVAPKALEADLANPGALLAQVKDAYATDPLVATRIAAASQYVMTGAGAAFRVRWTDALLAAAQAAPDAYRAEYFLDQLRWCGRKEQACAVCRAFGEDERASVRDMAAIVVRELK